MRTAAGGESPAQQRKCAADPEERKPCPRLIDCALSADLIRSFLHGPVAADLYGSKLALPRLATHASIYGDEGTGQVFEKVFDSRKTEISGTTLSAHVIKNHDPRDARVVPKS